MSLSVAGKKSGTMVVTKPSTGRASSKSTTAEDKALIVPLKDPSESPVASTSKDGDEGVQKLAKNIEIRRMSATEEGDKVLESAWDSPEKDSKTPLQMVQSIVSKIEEIKPTPASASSNQPPPPAWTLGSQRPLLHSQKQVANETPPTSRPPPSMIPPQQRSVVASMPHSVAVMATSQQLVPVSAGQQIMQLVNTINGPMLMQAIQAPHPPQIQIQDHKGMKGKKKSPSVTPQIAYQGHPNIMPGGAPMPILVSPSAVVSSQHSPTGAQHVLISHPNPGPGMIQGAPQFLLNHSAMIAPNQVFLSSNGTLVAMPAAPMQGVVYNQLPDGTLVQVQSPLIQQQTVITSNGSFVINNGGQQLSPNGGHIQFQPSPGGTYFMTPAGLVQTAPACQIASPAVSMASPGIASIMEPQPGPSHQNTTTTMLRKESTDKSDDSDEDDEEDHDEDETSQLIHLQEEEEEDDEEDESSDDEEIPLAKKKSPPTSFGKDSSKKFKLKMSSPKTYIQSNKVDSSGLQATPPHPIDETESCLNRLSSPEGVSTSTKDDALDTSGSTEGTSGSSPTKRRRKRNADELIKDDVAQTVESDGKH